MNNAYFLFAAVIIVLLLCPHSAYAYLDLGTGSYLFQLAIGFFVGALFGIRLFWGRIRDWFRQIIKRKDEESEADEHAK